MSEYYEQILISMFDKNVICDIDGFYKLFLQTESGCGCITAFDLRILANELDRKNEPLKKDLDEYFNESNNQKNSID